MDKPVEKCGTENYVPQTCVRKNKKGISNEGIPGIGELLFEAALRFLWDADGSKQERKIPCGYLFFLFKGAAYAHDTGNRFL